MQDHTCPLSPGRCSCGLHTCVHLPDHLLRKNSCHMVAPASAHSECESCSWTTVTDHDSRHCDTHQRAYYWREQHRGSQRQANDRGWSIFRDGCDERCSFSIRTDARATAAKDQVPTYMQLVHGCRIMFQSFQDRQKKLTDIFKGAAQCRKQK